MLYEDKDVRKSVTDLMAREMKEEDGASFPGSYVADGAGHFTFSESATVPTKFYRGMVP